MLLLQLKKFWVLDVSDFWVSGFGVIYCNFKEITDDALLGRPLPYNSP